MREISDALLEEISSGGMMPAILAEFEFESGTIRAWTGFGTLTWGEREFIGLGNFVSVSDIQETQDMQAAGVVMGLNGIPSSMISLATLERYQSRPCRLWLGMVNVTASVALEDDSGVFLTESGGKILLENQLFGDPCRIFTGLMDVMEFNDDGQTATIKLSAESVLLKLRRTKERRYTPEDQKSQYTGDRLFDYTAQLQDKELVW